MNKISSHTLLKANRSCNSTASVYALLLAVVAHFKPLSVNIWCISPSHAEKCVMYFHRSQIKGFHWRLIYMSNNYTQPVMQRKPAPLHIAFAKLLLVKILNINNSAIKLITKVFLISISEYLIYPILKSYSAVPRRTDIRFKVILNFTRIYILYIIQLLYQPCKIRIEGSRVTEEVFTLTFAWSSKYTN